jgi:hypothetical protein
VGVGLPVAVTVKLPAVPTVKVVLFALVIAGGAPILSVRVADWLWGGLLESVSLKVSDALLTACVGVPVIAPVDAKESPLGSVPLVSAQVYGIVPPLPASVAL